MWGNTHSGRLAGPASLAEEHKIHALTHSRTSFSPAGLPLISRPTEHNADAIDADLGPLAHKERSYLSACLLCSACHTRAGVAPSLGGSPLSPRCKGRNVRYLGSVPLWIKLRSPLLPSPQLPSPQLLSPQLPSPLVCVAAHACNWSLGRPPSAIGLPIGRDDRFIGAPAP